MGEKATMAKARMELEELYLGIPDESVNLTFQDLADVKKHAHRHPLHALSSSSSSSSATATAAALDPISENKPTKSDAAAAAASPVFRKLPSLDFSRGLQASNHHHPLNQSNQLSRDTRDSPLGHRSYVGEDHNDEYRYGHSRASSGRNTHLDMRRTGMAENISMAHDDMTSMSMSMSVSMAAHGQRRRPGVPHSNICTICSTYIYIFRHRCLVCGRVYCRQCVSIGMGEMTEGRKCIECLGRRFSQRYIQRAGQIGCCSRYPSIVKQAELKWAEKGPRRNAERAYGHGGGRSHMVSGSRSPVTPRTPTRAHPSSTGINTSNPPSFVYSPYSPHSHHHLPF
ncbi:uncharacterized protein LOC115683926 [Syzygium oleosum]|uniref:uncharacterized protein LOC115683926 n=1 Tax=Syzygium oleosum TaxID=219896 RepID=UPI0024BAEE97|nr:uncharacterized protein LOC115683926 [Syzygium oleosum]